MSCCTLFMRARASGEGSLSGMVGGERGGGEEERQRGRRASQEGRNTPYLFSAARAACRSQARKQWIFQATLTVTIGYRIKDGVRVAGGAIWPVMTSQEPW